MVGMRNRRVAGNEPVRARDRFAEARKQAAAKELLCRYCRLAYKETDTHEETARRSRLDGRIVKSDWDLGNQTSTVQQAWRNRHLALQATRHPLVGRTVR